MNTNQARQFWPSPVPHPDPLARVDGRLDGLTERPTVDPSISPSTTSRPSTRRALTSSEARLARWLETYCAASTTPAERPLRVDACKNRPGFVGARRLLLKHGAAAVRDALAEMTYVTNDDFGSLRYWQPQIVSPAQFLNWYLSQLAKETAP